MRPYRFPKPYADLAARLRVPCGFLLVAAFAYFSAPSFGSLALGLPLAAAGLLLRAWAAGHLAKNQRLATSGPYAYVRNPLYLGSFLIGLGVIIACGSLLLLVAFLILFLLLYTSAMTREAPHLRR